jgi:hypothetical protein
MNVTLSLEEELVRKVRAIAVDRDTTIAGLIRDYLEQLAAGEARSDSKIRQLRRLEESFQVQVKVGTRTWTREALHERL